MKLVLLDFYLYHLIFRVFVKKNLHFIQYIQEMLDL